MAGQPFTNQYGELISDRIPELESMVETAPGVSAGRSPLSPTLKRGIAAFGLVLWLVLAGAGAFFVVAGQNKGSLLPVAVVSVATPTVLITVTATPPPTSTPTPPPTPTPDPTLVAAYQKAITAFNDPNDPDGARTCVENLKSVVQKDPNFQEAAVAYYFACLQALADGQAANEKEFAQAVTTYNIANALYVNYKNELTQQFAKHKDILPGDHSDFISWAADLKNSSNVADWYAKGYANNANAKYADAVTEWTKVYNANPKYLLDKRTVDNQPLDVRSQLSNALYQKATLSCNAPNFEEAAAANAQALAIVNDNNGRVSDTFRNLLQSQKASITAKKFPCNT